MGPAMLFWLLTVLLCGPLQVSGESVPPIHMSGRRLLSTYTVNMTVGGNLTAFYSIACVKTFLPGTAVPGKAGFYQISLQTTDPTGCITSMQTALTYATVVVAPFVVNPDDTSTFWTLGAIIGISVGGAVFLGLVIYFVWWYYSGGVLMHTGSGAVFLHYHNQPPVQLAYAMPTLVAHTPGGTHAAWGPAI